MSRRKMALLGIVAVALAVTAGWSVSEVASQGGRLGHAAQHKNMQLVGHNDLQARSAYQPIVHQHPGGRWIAYVGHHGGTAFNPVTGVVESNGTSIVDVTDPRHPVYLKHLPGGAGVGEAGGAQMVRACNGSDLPRGAAGAVYILRATASAHEVWDVTDPAHPSLVKTVISNLGATHKNWWECNTGLAYLVSDGRRLDLSVSDQTYTTADNWRTNRMTQVYDLSNPAAPVFVRNYGLSGQEPGSSGAVPTGVHGMISTGPPPGIRGISDRIYAGHGTGSDGIMQVVDRRKLLDPTLCSTPPSANYRKRPTAADLLCPQIGRMDTSPTMGAHTTFPVLQQPVPEFGRNAAPGNAPRDLVILVNEAGGNTANGVCEQNRQLVYVVDVTIATGSEARPMGVANFQVPEASENFCSRGGRFGSHASNESFTEVFYGKLVFVSWFNAGVRAIDIREPWSPREAGFYVPATTANTDQRCATIGGQEICKIAIQTNNVEGDDRGLIYAVDRANTGLHILELTGDARKIIES